MFRIEQTNDSTEAAKLLGHIYCDAKAMLRWLENVTLAELSDERNLLTLGALTRVISMFSDNFTIDKQKEDSNFQPKSSTSRRLPKSSKK